MPRETKMFQCPYNKTTMCAMDVRCLGCEDFAGVTAAATEQPSPDSVLSKIKEQTSKIQKGLNQQSEFDRGYFAGISKALLIMNEVNSQIYSNRGNT